MIVPFVHLKVHIKTGINLLCRVTKVKLLFGVIINMLKLTRIKTSLFAPNTACICHHVNRSFLSLFGRQKAKCLLLLSFDSNNCWCVLRATSTRWPPICLEASESIFWLFICLWFELPKQQVMLPCKAKKLTLYFIWWGTIESAW